MPDPIIMNNDLKNPILQNAEFRDENLTHPDAGTILAGTLLARQTVALAVADGVVTGTGNGTVDSITVVPGNTVPLVGVYNLECVTAIVAHQGIFKLEDPNGAIVASGLQLTGGSGGATVFEAGGLEFTVTDGSTDFIVGDTIAITVVADGDTVPFVIAGAGGAQIPLMILTFDSVATGSGNLPIRAGVTGSYRDEKLIIDADGDGSNITNAIRDQLRNFGLVPIDVTELNIQDNQ